MAKAIHLADLRLRVNAGMDFPTCQARAKLLDLEKGRWNMVQEKDKVTCKKCKRIISGNNYK
jgi:hypothetical protein